MNEIHNLKNNSLKTDLQNSNEVENNNKESKSKSEKILCNHCGRTALNQIKCIGICVADNDY